MTPSKPKPPLKPVSPPLTKDEIIRRLKTLPKHQLAEVLDNLMRLKNLK